MSKSILAQVVGEPNLRRRELIKAIQDKTKRKLITYISRFDHPLGIVLEKDAMVLYDALNSIDCPSEIDLIIHSPGGSLPAAEKIVTMFRENLEIKNLRVIIPDMAKSAATLISFASNEILMSDLAELGPVDPQILVDYNQVGPVYRSAWSYKKSLEIIELELKENKRDLNIIIPLVQKIDPTLLDGANNAIKYSSTLAKVWLTKYMQLEPKKAEEIAVELSSTPRQLEHGRVIGLKEAIALGVKAQKIPNDIWPQIFELYVRSTLALKDKAAKLTETEETSIFS